MCEFRVCRGDMSKGSREIKSVNDVIYGSSANVNIITYLLGSNVTGIDRSQIEMQLTVFFECFAHNAGSKKG